MTSSRSFSSLCYSHSTHLPARQPYLPTFLYRLTAGGLVWFRHSRATIQTPRPTPLWWWPLAFPTPTPPLPPPSLPVDPITCATGPPRQPHCPHSSRGAGHSSTPLPAPHPTPPPLLLPCASPPCLSTGLRHSPAWEQLNGRAPRRRSIGLRRLMMFGSPPA